MLVETTTTTIIEAVVRSRLTKVALNSSDTESNEIGNLILIPFHGLGITQIQDSILVRQAACGILHRHTAINEFTEETVLGCKVWQLPQTSMETLTFQLVEHTFRVFETVFGKLIVTLPVNTKPSCIKMDNITWNLVLTELFSNLQTLFL